MLITTVSIFAEDIVRNRHLCFICITHLQSLPVNKWIKHRLDHNKKIMWELNIVSFVPFSEDSNKMVQGLLCYIHVFLDTHRNSVEMDHTDWLRN